LHAAPPLRPEQVPVVAIAVVASLLLHALLIAWPRWPTWENAMGAFAGSEAALHARLRGAASVRAQTEAAVAPQAVGAPVSAASTAAAPPGAGPDADAARSTPGVMPPSSPPQSPGRNAPSAETRRAAEVAANGTASASARPGPAYAPRATEGTTVARAASTAPGAAAPEPVAVAAAASESSRGAIAAARRGEAGEQSDIASIAQYRIALISVSRRFKPAADLMPTEGAEGRVDVHLAIDADGALAAARVLHSSGHPALDALALDMLRRAKAEAPVPPRLLDRAFEVEVPVVFGGTARR